MLEAAIIKIIEFNFKYDKNKIIKEIIILIIISLIKIITHYLKKHIILKINATEINPPTIIKIGKYLHMSIRESPNPKILSENISSTINNQKFIIFPQFLPLSHSLIHKLF